MRIAFGADEATHLTEAIQRWLEEHGHDLQIYGPPAGDEQTWPAVACQTAQAVAGGEADEGVLCCWTGTGVSIAANKVPGIRAALCADAETARGARLWNNANVLCLSLRLTSEPVTLEILEAWFSTRYEPNPEDDGCLAQLEALEARYLSADKR